jgi:hypothetical protein
MFAELVHRLTLPALATAIVLTVWVLAWEHSTQDQTAHPSMPALRVDHQTHSQLAQSGNPIDR